MQAILIVLFILFGYYIERRIFEFNRKKRRDYYVNVYLKSEAWQRKYHEVLNRDYWKCVKYGAFAKQVHHKRYAG